MKNNFSNFVKIIVIIIVLVLIIWLVFYIITKNEPAVSTNNSNSRPDENIDIIASELTTIFDYINAESNSSNRACQYLNNDLGYDITSGTNFFDVYAPAIMDCLYEKNYPTIYFDSETDYKIISTTEENSYESYFHDLKILPSVNEIYTPKILANYSPSILNTINNYNNEFYKIAYIVNDNNKNDITYEISRIYKSNDKYLAKIIAKTTTNEYTGLLEVEINNNHIIYSPLIFY